MQHDRGYHGFICLVKKHEIRFCIWDFNLEFFQRNAPYFFAQGLLGERFHLWQTKNATSTRQFCNDLLIQLRQAHLDPVRQQLRGGGVKLSFDDIIGGYNRIKDEYNKSAIGAKDVIAAVFYEFHPVSQSDG